VIKRRNVVLMFSETPRTRDRAFWLPAFKIKMLEIRVIAQAGSTCQIKLGTIAVSGPVTDPIRRGRGGMFNKELRQTRKSLKGMRKQLRSRAREAAKAAKGGSRTSRQAKKANKRVQKVLKKLK
jgi:hypothetical protein